MSAGRHSLTHVRSRRTDGCGFDEEDTLVSREYPVKAAHTSFRVVRAVQRHDGVGVSELARELDLSKSAVHKHVTTLSNLGYLARDGDDYHLGLSFLELGVAARNRLPVYEVSIPAMQNLAEVSGYVATLLVYEAGQAHRFDDHAVDAGVAGVMRTLRAMGMIDARLPRVQATRLIRHTRWVRARRGGIADIEVRLGEKVARGDRIASISDAFGMRPTQVKATESGWVIAKSLRPLVNSGDSLVHIGSVGGPDRDEPAEMKR